MLEFVGGFLISAGISLVLMGISYWCSILIRRRIVAASNRKLMAFIEKLKLESDLIKHELENDHKAGRETSELVFRDKEGILNTVKIIIDHDLDHLASNEEELKSMILKGETGTMTDLISGHNITEDHIGKVQEFIFSPQAVRDMRLAGMEPDEIVTRMLKASGRME